MKLLLTGSAGQIGTEIRLLCENQQTISLCATDLAELDITNSKQITAIIADFEPDVVINAAAYTSVDAAETDQKTAFAVNESGPCNLAIASQEAGIPLIHISTDFVFDGTQRVPYTENARPNPLNVYGQSKLAGERAVREKCARHVIIRTAWVYSPWGNNFMKTMLHLMAAGQKLRVVADQHGSPTAAADVASVIIAIADKLVNESSDDFGTYHYCGNGITTWHGFATEIAAAAGSAVPITAISTEDYPTPAQRPQYSALNCDLIQEKFSLSTLDWQIATQREAQRYLAMKRKETIA